MKRSFLLALAACLLLSGCGGDTVPAEQGQPPQTEQVEQTEPPVVEMIPPVEELLEHKEVADWQEAYAVFLETKVEEAVWQRDPDNPDYDPNWADLKVNEILGTYVLYDMDKDGIPELLIRYGGAEATYHTTVYGYADGAVTELGDIPSGHSSFYAWPEENAVARNWGHMGGHFVEKIGLAGGSLTVETVFEEGYAAGDEEVTAYTNMADIVPGSSYLWENRTFMENPTLQALTLPVYDYGKDRMPQPLDPARDALAEEKIKEALSGFGAFYGVSADGFGGDTGWIGLQDYLAPNGATPYAESPLEIAETTWADYNGDGQTDAMLTLCHSEGDPYGGTMQVIFSLEEDGVVYAYCLNYMDAYEIKDTVFVSRYGDASFRVDFDGPESYAYTVIKEEP